jgi:carboxylesterase
MPFIQVLSWLQPKMPKGPPDWHDLEAAKDHIDYPYYPTRAIAELRDLLNEMRAALPKVSVPVLLIHSRQDPGVLPHNAEQILAQLGSQDKHLLWVENSGHVITREPEKQVVFKAAEDFIRRIQSTG